MTRAEDIATRLAEVRQQIAAAEARAHRPAGVVRLVAVSKKMPVDDVRAAWGAGQRDFGENYAQELRDKRAAFAVGETSPTQTEMPRWHYLGPLQRNKVKFLAGQVALIHSVADDDILDEIERRAAVIGASQACLIQVNVAGEAQKSGARVEAVPALLDRFARAQHVTCAGLMLIPPLTSDGAETRRHFAALRALREREAAISRPHVDLQELSMGMSDDFAVAIEEGSTLVRVGTAIFGARVPG
jgi:pyridoxal phosphate enzyme (YggS family)